MGTYPCVVPVSWGRLTDVVLPAWMNVLAGRDPIQSFCRAFARTYWPYFDPERGGPRAAELSTELPANYLADVKWSADEPAFAADNLRKSSQHADLARRSFTSTASLLVGRAISTHASFELSGPDPCLDVVSYGRLHHPPACQVAGTRDHYHFLRTFFVCSFDDRGPEYRYDPRPSVGGQLLALLEALFLARRSFPGLHVLSDNGRWPATNDHCVQGYLLPREVRQLASYLDELTARVREDEAGKHKDHPDVLFPLFLDRVRRSSDQGLGLVTLHDEL